jgi:hypothetical protein
VHSCIIIQQVVLNEINLSRIMFCYSIVRLIVAYASLLVQV